MLPSLLLRVSGRFLFAFIRSLIHSFVFLAASFCSLVRPVCLPGGPREVWPAPPRLQVVLACPGRGAGATGGPAGATRWGRGCRLGISLLFPPRTTSPRPHSAFMPPLFCVEHLLSCASWVAVTVDYRRRGLSFRPLGSWKVWSPPLIAFCLPCKETLDERPRNVIAVL